MYSLKSTLSQNRATLMPWWVGGRGRETGVGGWAREEEEEGGINHFLCSTCTCTCSANSVTTPRTLSSNSSFVFSFCFLTVSLTLEVGIRRQSNSRSICEPANRAAGVAMTYNALYSGEIYYLIPLRHEGWLLLNMNV